MDDNILIKTKPDYTTTESLAMQTDLNILSNKQRAEQAEILEIRNLIATISDSITKNSDSLKKDRLESVLKIRIDQIDESIKQINLQKETSLRLRKNKALRLKGMGLSDKDQIRIIDNEIYKIRKDYEKNLRLKQSEKRQIENQIRSSKMVTNRKKTSNFFDESRLKRLIFMLGEKEEECRKREILIRDLKQKLHYI